MGVVMERYAESGGGSGLEVLGYEVPILTAIGGAVAVLMGALGGEGLRRRPDRDLHGNGSADGCCGRLRWTDG